MAIDDSFNTQVNYRLIEALSASESRYRQLIEHLSEIVFTLDNEGRFTFLNPAWYQHTGYSVDHTVGQPIQHFIHPDDLLQTAQSFLGGEDAHFDLRFTGKDKQVLWFEATIKPVLEHGHVKEVFGTFIDVTGRIKAAEELKASQERFSLAATATNDGIWDWNLLTDEVYFSPRWKEMLGYQPDELESRYSTWYNLIHPEDVNETIATLMACLEGKNNLYENIHRLKNKNGGWTWILDRGVILRDKAGIGLRMAGSHADITHLKQIEDELLERQTELNTIFSMSPDGIVTIAPSGLISSVSPAFLSMTGYALDELLLIPEQAFFKKIWAISVPDLPFDENYAFSEIQIIPITEKRAAITSGSAENPNVRILKVTVCNHETESALKVMYFRDVTIETQVDRMKSEFLSTAAHELRTPMASVFGFTELLLTREFDRPTMQEILQNIHQQSASLVRMINDLLDLAKIEARMGKEFNRTQQPLELVAKQALAEFMMHGDNRSINVVFPEDSHYAFIDADQIKRAITNIISNAFKYSPSGGKVCLSINVRNIYGFDEVGVLVKDHGIGMTEEQLSHIYERFWRGSGLSNITGTGLGMSLVKEIMEFHQGKVEISSQYGIGTTVGLWFKLINGSGLNL